MKIICKKCGTTITLFNKKVNIEHRFIDGEIIKLHCVYCAKQLEDNLKEKYFVETYKNNNIYCENNKYYPYWGYTYYFNTLEDCRRRIDNRYCSYVNTGDFYTLYSTMLDD